MSDWKEASSFEQEDSIDFTPELQPNNRPDIAQNDDAVTDTKWAPQCPVMSSLKNQLDVKSELLEKYHHKLISSGCIDDILPMIDELIGSFQLNTTTLETEIHNLKQQHSDKVESIRIENEYFKQESVHEKQELQDQVRRLQIELATAQTLLDEMNESPLNSIKSAFNFKNPDDEAPRAILNEPINTLNQGAESMEFDCLKDDPKTSKLISQIYNLKARNIKLSDELKSTSAERDQYCDKISQLEAKLQISILKTTGKRSKSAPFLAIPKSDTDNCVPPRVTHNVQSALAHEHWLALKILREKIGNLELNLKKKTELLEKSSEKNKIQAQLIEKLQGEKFKLTKQNKLLTQKQEEIAHFQILKNSIMRLIAAIDRKLYHKERNRDAEYQVDDDIQAFNALITSKISAFLLDYERLERNLANEQHQKSFPALKRMQIEHKLVQDQLQELITESGSKAEKITLQTAHINELRSAKNILLKEIHKHKTSNNDLNSQIEDLQAQIKHLSSTGVKYTPGINEAINEVLKRENQILKIQVEKLSGNSVIPLHEPIPEPPKTKQAIKIKKLEIENMKLKENLREYQHSDQLHEEYQELQLIYKHAIDLNKEYEGIIKKLKD